MTAGMRKTFSKFGALVFFMAMHYAAQSQHIGIDTIAIKALIQEWNFANNTRSVETFENVYGDRLLFYTQDVSEAEAIALKQKLFRAKPGFRQTIVSGIRFTPYTSGVIKCDFIKDVWERSGWRKYPSYLLVSFQNNRYEIVGESDDATDRILKYDLNIGEPMRFESVTAEQTDKEMDSSVMATDTRASAGSATRVISAPIRLPGALSSMFSMGAVTVPKVYVFFLVGFLVFGALLIFIRDSIESGKRKKGVVREIGDEADDVIAEFKMQSVFEAFVVTLFDPLFFRHRRPAAERVYAGKVSEGDSGPDLEFDYRNKDIHARFAIKCLYYRRWNAKELEISHLSREFEEESDMALYYVLGIGGAPDDPRELYLVPSEAPGRHPVTRESLRPFVKSGMFYFNRSTGRLQ